MKILAFTDMHGDLTTFERLKRIVKEKNIDLVICIGDYTFFENHIEFLTKKLSELGTEVLVIHGNHEDEVVVRILSKRYKNMHFIHNKAKKIENFIFIGHGGGGFHFNDPDFVKALKILMNNISKKEKLVLITHAPPFNTKLDKIPRFGHVGNKDYRRFIQDNNVVLAISGHLHETFNKEDKLGKARIFNPGLGEIIILE